MPTNEFLEERIAMRIAKATDALQKSFELSPRLVSAAEQLSNCILNDGKDPGDWDRFICCDRTNFCGSSHASFRT